MLVLDIVHDAEPPLQVTHIRLHGEQQDAQAGEGLGVLHLIELAEEPDWILVLVVDDIQTVVQPVHPVAASYIGSSKEVVVEAITYFHDLLVHADLPSTWLHELTLHQYEACLWEALDEARPNGYDVSEALVVD